MQLIISFCLLVVLCACQTSTPRVGSVWMTHRKQVIDEGDTSLFLNSRASFVQTANQSLPAEKQGEEFYVSWSGPGIELVKLEYRQVGRPDQIAVQQFAPGKARSHSFPVVGKERQQGGAISSWRVSLWHGDQLLAEKKSSLW